MAACQMIDKKEDNFNTQRRTNGMKKSTLSTPTPCPSSSTRRLQEIIISTPTRRSSTGMHRNAPTLPSLEARSSSSGKDRRYSLANVVARATNDVNRHSSHYAARLPKADKDCQNSFSAGTANDVNRHYSHHDTSSSAASPSGSHYIPSNNKLKNGSLPSSSRFSHPNRSSSNHASSSDIVNHGASNPTSSSDMVNRTASHPTSSSNDLMSQHSLQPATLQGDDTDFENSRSGLSNGASTGNEQTHSQPCMAEPSFPHRKFNSAHVIPSSNIGSTSHSGLQGKLASRKLANTSSKLCESGAAAPKSNARVAKTYTKSRAGIRDSVTRHRPNELCKDCRASIMESVCFIANDGRISAAITGAAYARHNHHCNVSGCAANRSYYPSLSPLSKIDSRSKRQALLNPQPTRTKSHALSSIGDRRSTGSSAQGEDCSKQEMELSLRGSVEMSSTTRSDTHGTKHELNLKEMCHNSFAIKCSEEGDESHEGTDSLCRVSIDQNGLDVFSPCKDHSQSPSMQVPKDKQSSGENSHVENVEVHSTPAASCISFDDDNDDDDDVDDDEKASIYRDDIQALNDFKSLLYHGDNEYSCSEDGTDATTTPNSVIKGAFDDLSNIDILQSSCENEVLHPRKSTMARMRQKYLESLREQEAETVRLRKQEIMARKQAGDWMLDCHMGEVLHKLAPNGEVRVKVLVEAFETVIQHSDSESSQMANHQDQDHLENLHSYASF